MDGNLYFSEEMDDESPQGTKREDGLLSKLTGTAEDVHPEVKAGRKRCIGEDSGEEVQTRSGEGVLGPVGHEKKDEGNGRSADEEQCERKALLVLEEMRIFHSETVAAWRDALRECGCMFNKSPAGGSGQQLPSCPDSFSDHFQSVVEDVEKIMQKLSTIITKLDVNWMEGSAGRTSACQETSDPQTPAEPEDGNSHLSVSDPHETESSEHQREVEEERGSGPSPDTEQTTDFTVRSSGCDDVGETE